MHIFVCINIHIFISLIVSKNLLNCEKLSRVNEAFLSFVKWVEGRWSWKNTKIKRRKNFEFIKALKEKEYDTITYEIGKITVHDAL